MVRSLFLLMCVLLATTALAEDWTVWEDFDDLVWYPEPWPMTQSSEIVWDASRSVSGETSLRTTITGSGWGGALKVLNRPVVSPPEEEMSVRIYCQALPDAGGVPNAKLEVYSQEKNETLGGPDTPLRLDKWKTVHLPASVFNRAAEGIGIIFLQGDCSGEFQVWVDLLERDGEVWEDFEYANTSFWRPVNITGPYEYATLDPGLEEPPELEKGRAVRLRWMEDSDGVELKKALKPALDMSEWGRIRVRAWLPTDGKSLRVSLWLFDGENGTFSSGPLLTAEGEWGWAVHDLTAHRDSVDLGHITEMSIVLHDYDGDSGEIVIDRLEYSP